MTRLSKTKVKKLVHNLTLAGERLSNIAFNLSQPTVAASDHQRAIMRECVRDWDSAERELRDNL